MKIQNTILIVNDIIILNCALIESKFFAIFFGEKFTFESWFGWTVASESAYRFDPFSTSFDSETVPIITGQLIIDIILRFLLGIMVFLIIKFILAIVFKKIGVSIALPATSKR